MTGSQPPEPHELFPPGPFDVDSVYVDDHVLPGFHARRRRCLRETSAERKGERGEPQGSQLPTTPTFAAAASPSSIPMTQPSPTFPMTQPSSIPMTQPLPTDGGVGDTPLPREAAAAPVSKEQAADVEKHLATAGVDLDGIEMALQNMSAAEDAIRKQMLAGSTFPDDELDNEIALLEAALRSGVNVRETLGVRFGRSDDGGKNPEYRDLKTNKEKADFRANWAKLKLAETRARKTKTTTWSEIDTNLGQYLPLALVFWEEGQRGVSQLQDEAAVVAGLRYAAMCVKMGGKFLSYNTWTKRNEYFHVRKTHKQEFMTCWQQYEEARARWAAGTAIEGGSPAATAPKAEAAVHEVTRAPKRARGADGSSTKSPRPPAEPKEKTKLPKKTRTSLDVALSEAAKIKQEYQKIVVTSDNLLKSVNTDAHWAWADDVTKVGLVRPLKEKLGELNSRLTAFGRKFLTTEPKDLKKEMKPANLEIDLKEFIQLQVRIASLQSEVNILTGISKSRAAEASRAEKGEPGSAKKKPKTTPSKKTQK